VLRKFRRQSALRTYLASVIKRMYLDYRIAAWGKWRPSARSRRAGDTAVLFERLTIRDGLTFDEACVMLETNHGRKVDIDALERTFAALRPASRPRFVSDADLFGEPGAEPRGDAIAAAAEHHEIVDETTRILAAALAALDPTDRDVLTLRFRDGASLAAIARRLKIDQKSSYRRLKRVLRRLRESLEAAGLSRAAVMSALERSDAGIGRVFAGDRPERSAASVETCLVA
jgi:RNA polymerase sigma factor for flagellar operon FliA